MIDLHHIYSLSDFQRNAREHIDRLKRTRRPEVLTVNGRAELVVQDTASYQELLDRIESREGADRLQPDPLIEAYKTGVDRTLLRENLQKTADERLQGLIELQRLAEEARGADRAGLRRPVPGGGRSGSGRDSK